LDLAKLQMTGTLLGVMSPGEKPAMASSATTTAAVDADAADADADGMQVEADGALATATPRGVAGANANANTNANTNANANNADTPDFASDFAAALKLLAPEEVDTYRKPAVSKSFEKPSSSSECTVVADEAGEPFDLIMTKVDVTYGQSNCFKPSVSHSSFPLFVVHGSSCGPLLLVDGLLHDAMKVAVKFDQTASPRW
jgi:hypothetical protein